MGGSNKADVLCWDRLADPMLVDDYWPELWRLSAANFRAFKIVHDKHANAPLALGQTEMIVDQREISCAFPSRCGWWETETFVSRTEIFQGRVSPLLHAKRGRTPPVAPQKAPLNL